MKVKLEKRKMVFRLTLREAKTLLLEKTFSENFHLLHFPSRIMINVVDSGESLRIINKSLSNELNDSQLKISVHEEALNQIIEEFPSAPFIREEMKFKDNSPFTCVLEIDKNITTH